MSDTTIEDLECRRYTVLNYQCLGEAYLVSITDSEDNRYRLHVREGALFNKLSDMRHKYEKSNFTDVSMLKQFTFIKENICFNGIISTYAIVVPDNSITVLT